ncbi:MAG: hypothetical protein HYX86_03350 [Chloroflexi bacterium]|nr:hypothetical protein [Chloroflexota bacterium]
MLDYLPVAGIAVLTGFLGAKRGTKSQIIFLGVIAATWLFIGITGQAVAVWILSLLRGGLSPDSVGTQPDLLLPPQEASLINTFLFGAVLAGAYIILWRGLPSVNGLVAMASGGVFGLVNGMLINLYLFRLSPATASQPFTPPPDSVSPLRLQTPGETAPAGLPPLVVLGILLLIFLAVRAIQRPTPGSGMGGYES